jgi:hypothetical protein
MIYDKALIISRYHDDISNPIYNAYVRGIQSQCSIIHFVDYFDQIGALGKDGFEDQIITILEQENINLIFFIFVSGDPILDPYFIQKVATNRFIAMVFWDTEQFFEQIDRYYAQLADLVILPANYEYIYKLNLLGINAICPFSLFDSTKYKPNATNMEQNIDVSFVGEVTKGKRKEYINYLEENGIDIQAYGSGTKNGRVSFERVVDIFNTSKINLSFTGTYDNSTYSFCSNINNRILQNKGKPIEIALCGGFVLTEYVPGIEKVFPNKSIDTFSTKEELLKKVKYYLNNEQLRQTMKNEAYQYSINHYDSIIAFKKIFSTINSITPKKEKELILDNIFIKIYNTFHLFYVIAFLSQGRISLAVDELKIVIKNPKFIIKDVLIHIKSYFISFKMRYDLKKKINSLIIELKKNQIVIYGAGLHTIALFTRFPNLKNLNIKAITDTDKKLQSGSFLHKKLIEPSKIPDYGDTIIISSFKFRKEIRKHIESLNFKDIKIIELYDDTISRDVVSFSRDAVSIRIHQRTDPYQIYRNSLTLK